jgi:hypothetical protein
MTGVSGIVGEGLLADGMRLKSIGAQRLKAAIKTRLLRHDFRGRGEKSFAT